ncbi:MAG: hypothetical protein AABZ74_03145 [Cyanobacteriota bacterium]
MKTKKEVFNTEKTQSNIYSFDHNIDIKLNNKLVNFKDILIEHNKKDDKQNIFLACDNISTELVLELSKLSDLSIQDVSHLNNSEKVSVIFSLKEDIINKYFLEYKTDQEMMNTEDDKGNNILFSLSNYNLDELLAYSV